MCIGTGQVDWQAVSAIGTLAGVVLALALALTPWLSRRGSWRKVSLVAIEGFDRETGGPTLQVYLFNGSEREVRSVELDIWTTSERGQEYRDPMLYPFVHAGETKQLHLGQYQAVPTPLPLTGAFTDWTGRRFTVRSDQKPTHARPREESAASTTSAG